METVDAVIVGAGVVGLAVAYRLSGTFRHLAVFERNESFGMETSSRNSEVIHGGMYYPVGTLKARLCVLGRRALYELCAKHEISHAKIGKLIVATDPEEIPALEKIYELGIANGVEGLRMITRGELRVMESNVAGIAALHSAETGIIDSHRLMQFYADSAQRAGAYIVYRSEVTAITKNAKGYIVTVGSGTGVSEVQASVVINCAGLDSDDMAALAGIDIDKNGYRLHYCKGQYFRVSARKSAMIKRLVYPVPKPKAGGLGIHATLDTSGSMRLGPDDGYLRRREKDYSVDLSRAAAFLDSARKLMPFLEAADLNADTAGIRPKLQEKGGLFRDFVITDESANGCPGLINLIGIESPGLTASLAIAEYVAACVR